jgi:NAD(P)H-quinone oxidoreductase subunit 5
LPAIAGILPPAETPASHPFLEARMVTTSLWLAALGPLCLAGIGIVGGRAPAVPIRFLTWVAVAAAMVTFCISIATIWGVAQHGTLRSPLLGAAGIGFSLYADRLSAIMLCLVAFIGTVVLNYSRTYMDGDPGHARFTGLLCLTLSAVLLFIVAGNVLLFIAASFGTSVGLNRLLVFYPERQAALIAARKKFLVSRLGDICLIAAAVLLYRMFGSLDYATLFTGFEALRAGGQAPAAAGLVAILLICTAMLKSAQFPLHGWLIEVMETPTPVSALLHAGIINAGGFLVLRFAGLIALSVPALDTLAILGGLTALFGSVVMLTQTSIKVSLAYSTIAQMGFMMLECGLGAFSAALLHIVAHSLYKAHAFLSSGSVIDIARASWTPSPGGKPHPARLLIAIGVVLAITFVLSRVFGATIEEKPGVFALASVLLLGLTHLVANGIDERPNSYVVLHTLMRAGLAAAAYFGLQFGAERLMAGSLPVTQALRGPFGVAVIGLVVVSFAMVTFLQGLVPRRASEPKWQALYAHVANGFYVNTLANRLILQYWPKPLPAKPATLHAMVEV